MPITNKIKEEPIFIQIGDEIIELKDDKLKAFNEERAKDQAEEQARIEAYEAQKELKISAYKKLGLTDEEIAAII